MAEIRGFWSLNDNIKVIDIIALKLLYVSVAQLSQACTKMYQTCFSFVDPPPSFRLNKHIIRRFRVCFLFTPLRDF